MLRESRRTEFFKRPGTKKGLSGYTSGWWTNLLKLLGILNLSKPGWFQTICVYMEYWTNKPEFICSSSCVISLYQSVINMTASSLILVEYLMLFFMPCMCDRLAWTERLWQGCRLLCIMLWPRVMKYDGLRSLRDAMRVMGSVTLRPLQMLSSCFLDGFQQIRGDGQAEGEQQEVLQLHLPLAVALQLPHDLLVRRLPFLALCETHHTNGSTLMLVLWLNIACLWPCFSRQLYSYTFGSPTLLCPVL